MKNCFKAFSIPALFALLMAFMPLVSCTSVDDTLGMGLLPDDQKIAFGVNSVGGIDSYLAISDSIPTSRLGQMFLGNYKSDIYGLTSCAMALQFVPGAGAFDNDDFYGDNPIADSIMLRLYIQKIHGDPSVEQKFYIYEVKKDLYPDSLYYSNMRPEDVADLSNPLFSFTLVNEVEDGGISKYLTYESGADDYLKRLVTVDPDLYNEPDSSFQRTFKGFFIMPSQNEAEAPKNAAVYDILMSNSGGDYSFLSVYAHNHQDTPVDDKEHELHQHEWGQGYVKDTIAVYYTFDDTGYYALHPNTSVLLMDRDYESVPLGFDFSTVLINPDSLPPSAVPVETMYMQGMMGVATYLYFPDEFVNTIKSWAVYEGEQCNLMVNRAKLIMYLEDATLDALDNAPTRLGMYYDLKSQFPTNMPDYMYYEESYYSYTSAYGGYINRSQGRYEMDISMYVRKLLKDDDTQREIWLAPGIANGTFFSFNDVALTNTTDPTDYKRMEVEVTYTLFKNK